MLDSYEKDCVSSEHINKSFYMSFITNQKNT